MTLLVAAFMAAAAPRADALPTDGANAQEPLLGVPGWPS